MENATTETPSSGASSAEGFKQLMFFSGEQNHSESIVNTEPTQSAFMISSQQTQLEATESGPVLNKPLIQSITGPILLTLCILGLIGNITSFVVMSGRPFQRLPICRALQCLAVSDAVYITLLLNNNTWFRQLIHFDIKTGSDIGCKLFTWGTRSTVALSAWLLALIAVERFCAIWFPHKAQQLFTTKTTLIYVAAILCTIGSFSAFWSYYSTALVGKQCLLNVTNDTISNAMMFISLPLFTFIPMALIIVCNLLTMGKVLWHKKQNIAAQKSTNKSKEGQIMAMLMTVTCSFVILYGPIVPLHTYGMSIGESMYQTNVYALYITGQMMQIFVMINFSINFYLYVISGGTFRTYLFSLISCCGRKQSQGNNVNMTQLTDMERKDTTFSSEADTK